MHTSPWRIYQFEPSHVETDKRIKQKAMANRLKKAIYKYIGWSSRETEIRESTTERDTNSPDS